MLLHLHCNLRWRKSQTISIQRAAARSNDAPESASTTAADPTAPSTVTPAAAVATERSAAGQSGSSSSVDAVFNLLSNPEHQSTAFLLLAVTSALFGVAAFSAPELLLSAALGAPATPLDAAFTRIAGATMAISAAAEYSLKVDSPVTSYMTQVLM
jgi:hypothetical protein